MIHKIQGKIGWRLKGFFLLNPHFCMSLVEQVRPYPRRAFSDGESTLSLNELGLTSKQEALFLELI